MDIVERLRRYAPCATKPRVAEIMDGAAYEILHLRAELAARDKEIADWLCERGYGLTGFGDSPAQLIEAAEAIKTGEYRGTQKTV